MKQKIVILIGLCILTGLFFLPVGSVYASEEDTEREPGVISVNAEDISEDEAAEEDSRNPADDLIRETRRAPFLGLAAAAVGGAVALFIIRYKNRDGEDEYGEDE